MSHRSTVYKTAPGLSIPRDSRHVPCHKVLHIYVIAYGGVLHGIMRWTSCDLCLVTCVSVERPVLPPSTHCRARACAAASKNIKWPRASTPREESQERESVSRLRATQRPTCQSTIRYTPTLTLEEPRPGRPVPGACWRADRQSYMTLDLGIST